MQRWMPGDCLNALTLIICLGALQPGAPHDGEPVLQQLSHKVKVLKVQQVHQLRLHISVAALLQSKQALAQDRRD